MRIDEVTASNEQTLQSYDWKNPRQVAGWLRKKGFQLIGAGAFGAVFAKPGSNKLVKISRRDDVCWLRFAHWTLGMKSNPAVPYIDWVHTYEGEDGTEFFIAVIEKLAHFNATAVRNTRDVPGLAYLLYLQYTDGPSTELSSEIEDAILDRLIKEGVVTDDDFKTDYVTPKTVKKLHQFVTSPSSKGGRVFINALNTAKKQAYGKCSFDLHDGNLMYRPSDQRLVVIDPIGDLDSLDY